MGRSDRILSSDQNILKLIQIKSICQY